MSQYILRPPTDDSDPYEKEPTLLHEQKRVHAIFQTPMIKMSYNDYLIREGDKIISIGLPDGSKHWEYQDVFREREVYESQVRRFVGQDRTNGGGYYFYNWVSNDQYMCQLPTSGVPLLATHLFNYDYEKAQALIEKWQKNIITETLSTIFRGFVNLIKIVQGDPELHRIFFNKKIHIKQSVLPHIQQPPSHNKLLLITTPSSLEGILDQYPSLQQKKSCILANLSYLKQFLLYFPSSQINDYYKLIFAFLSNTEDQLQSRNMYGLLLECREICLLDRLNFVQKLVPLEGRREFVGEFSVRVLGLTHLSNLLFFQAKDQECMERIITNYLDQYGDLESVASVCLEYGVPKLMSFVDIYQQILVLSCQQKKAQDLEYQQYKKLGSFCLKKPLKPQPTSHLFLHHLNFQQQRIEPIKNKQEDFTKICYVCYRKNEFNQDLFVECGRCKHGGHLQHLLKWYQDSNNVCPKTDCPCYCV